MSRRCSIDVNKGCMSGNTVSHSNRKNRRRFLPNMQICSLQSDILGKFFTLRMTPSSLRTIDHNDGLDNYLITTSNSKLSAVALSLKNKVIKALAKESVSG